MTTDEVIGALKANIGRTVRVIYAGARQSCSLYILSIDDEGFVNDPL